MDKNMENRAIKELLYVLDECFDGEGRDVGVFLESYDAALFPMLRALDVEEASRPIAGASILHNLGSDSSNIGDYAKAKELRERILVKQVNRSFILARRNDGDTQGIVTEAQVSHGVDRSVMVSKINIIDMHYKLFFSMDREIILAEAIRRPSMKKGLGGKPLNP